MQIAVNFQNDTIAQKVIWMLDRFKDDGVEVITLDDSDEMIVKNFREGLDELKEIHKGNIQTRAAHEFLHAL